MISSPRSSRHPETKLRPTGHLSSPRHLRDKTLRTSSPTLDPPHPLLPQLPPVHPLPLLPPPRRRRRKKSPLKKSTWEASSETMAIEQLRVHSRYFNKYRAVGEWLVLVDKRVITQSILCLLLLSLFSNKAIFTIKYIYLRPLLYSSCFIAESHKQL